MQPRDAVLLASLLLTPVSALGYVSSDGHEYNSACNANGYVLTSLYPVARAVGYGASTEHVSGIETLYLGKSCDAYTKGFGSGTWCWANGGFLADFGGLSVGFPRQELFCSSDESLGSDCVCQ